MLTRRSFIAGSAILSLLATTGTLASASNHDFYWDVAELEKNYGGRLGVTVIDTATGQVYSHRGRERFALCSTFKILAAAYILSRFDQGKENLSRKIAYSKEQLVAYSPETEKHEEMTLSDICRAAIIYSDNTAGNLMLESFGGPEELNKYLASIGDNVTRLDRYETDLNDVRKGELRDTTTPLAMATTLQAIMAGDVLSGTSKRHLKDWMLDNTTGDKRLRAGLPKNWKIGDKTGSGNRNETNDVAIIWPPKRLPLIVSVYYAESSLSSNKRNEVISGIGKLVSKL